MIRKWQKRGFFTNFYQNAVTSNRRQHIEAKTASNINAAKTKPFSDIPEPKGLFGTFLDYTALRGFKTEELYSHYQKRHKKYGPIFKENVLPGLTSYDVFCSSAEANKAMFRLEDKYSNRGPLDFIQIARENAGVSSGLLDPSWEEWFKFRKVANRYLLSNASVWSYSSALHEVCDDFVDYIADNLDENNEFPNFALALNKWALEGAGVFCLDTRFGNFSGQLDDNLKVIMDQVIESFTLMTDLFLKPPLYKYITTRKMKALTSVVKKQSEAIQKQRVKIMNQMKEKTPGSKTKLKTVLENSDLNEEEIASLVSDMLGGGVDTTSNAAAFMLYIMAVNPDKQEILREEIKTALQSGKVDGRSVQTMKYLHACVQETQRLFPFSFGVARMFEKDIEVCGYNVPAGTRILLTGNVVNNKDAKYFKDPETFLPERWLERRNSESKFATTGAFGRGVRACPGRKFAMQEVHYLLISLLSRYKVEYHHKPIKPHFRLLTVPSEKPQFTFIPLS
uniref:Cytochrome P450 10 n=1 Tax=Ciona intestinalis TaxID=7719 RepID=F6Z1X8_CIOIN|nr:cytochrome P450 10 [Ciona intestinalis]|eukprot:XP_002127166.1 cytochrome P450 10 [Ciona intestinalis]